MTLPERAPRLAPVLAFAANPRFASALVLCIVGATFGSHLISSVLGLAGFVAVLASLILLSSLVLVARWGTFEWRWLLPISLIVFIAWSAVSVFWSSYQWVTVGAIVAQLAICYLGIFVAVARDIIQIVRAFGDVLRIVIGLSLVVEVIAGLLLDTPIDFLGVQGDLAEGGPIQGIMGSRNQLSLIALLAIVTFAVELVTNSVHRPLAIGSIAAAAVTLLFSQSPIGFGVLLLVGVAGLALLLLRRLEPEPRRRSQIALGVTAAVALLVSYFLRARIINWLDASNEIDYRLAAWRQLMALQRVHPLEGWGWMGAWRTDVLPYSVIETGRGAQYSSALNSYIDVWFQVGLVGLASLVALLGLAFTRTWIVASRQRSRAYVWPALVLIALLATSLFESSLLVAYGGLIVVICVVKAAENLSWRRALPD